MRSSDIDIALSSLAQDATDYQYAYLVESKESLETYRKGLDALGNKVPLVILHPPIKAIDRISGKNTLYVKIRVLKQTSLSDDSSRLLSVVESLEMFADTTLKALFKQIENTPTDERWQQVFNIDSLVASGWEIRFSLTDIDSSDCE